MKQDESIEIEQELRQIADVLLMSGNLMNNPGLYTGEMGLVLFFARYAQSTQDDLYMDYAFDLMENIQKIRLHRYSPIGYKHGLAGIGSAIEYLVQNGYFEANTDAVLDDFDIRIFHKYNLRGMSPDEITDVWYYVNWRLSGNSARKDYIRQAILPQIETVMLNYTAKPSQLQLLKKNVLPDIFKEKTYSRYLELVDNKDFWNKNRGIQDGLAGWGLSLLTILDGDNSWFLLFPDKINNI